MAGIYIHVPFCRQACHYCDFHFSTNHSRIREMVDAIIKEIWIRKDYLKNDSISSIYFGGGTPSLLDHYHLEGILSQVAKFHTVEYDCEITLEANPDDISVDMLRDWEQLGINRISLGVQSFDDRVLKFMNRIHTSADAWKAVDLCKGSEISDLSIDLIYGFFDDNHQRWEKDLDHVVSIGPDHISAYCLTIEEKTVYGKWLKKGIIEAVPDDFCAAEYHILTTRMKSAKYLHYEVSNFCLDTKESRHNSGYWKGQKYLGVGPGAHSFDLESRQYNISNNAIYLKALHTGKVPAEFEKLDRIDKINEYLMTTLRTYWGASLTHLKEEFSYDLMKVKGEYLAQLIAQDQCIVENDVLRLSSSGLLLADKITSDLFVDRSIISE